MIFRHMSIRHSHFIPKEMPASFHALAFTLPFIPCGLICPSTTLVPDSSRRSGTVHSDRDCSAGARSITKVDCNVVAAIHSFHVAAHRSGSSAFAREFLQQRGGCVMRVDHSAVGSYRSAHVRCYSSGVEIRHARSF